MRAAWTCRARRRRPRAGLPLVITPRMRRRPRAGWPLVITPRMWRRPPDTTPPSHRAQREVDRTPPLTLTRTPALTLTLTLTLTPTLTLINRCY